MNRYSYVLNNPLKYTDPSGYNYKPIYWDEAIGGFIPSFSLFSRENSAAAQAIAASNARIDQMAGIVRDENGNYLYNAKQDILTGQDAIDWINNNLFPNQNNYSDQAIDNLIAQNTQHETPGLGFGGKVKPGDKNNKLIWTPISFNNGVLQFETPWE